LSSGVENPENPEYSPVAKGLLVTRNSGAYVAEELGFWEPEGDEAGWASASGSIINKKEFEAPEREELELFGASFFTEASKYIGKSSDHQYWEVYLNSPGYLDALPIPPVPGFQNGSSVDHTVHFSGLEPIPNDELFNYFAVAVNWGNGTRMENTLTWPTDRDFSQVWNENGADYFAKQEAPTAGIALSVGSSYYVVSGLWGDAVITYLYDVTNANVRSQKSVDRLLSGQFSNGIVYSQNRESVTFYNALADKKLFSIMTGNLGLIDWRGYFPWCFQGSVHPDFLQLEQKLSGSERLRVSDFKARRSRKLIRGVID